jgi:hypothetical protein
MKKLLFLTMLAGSLIFVVPAVEAKTAASSEMGLTVTLNAEQPGRRWNRGNRWNRRTYSVIRTRTVWRWGRRYRETYRTTYYPNGRTRTQLIRRVRVW